MYPGPEKRKCKRSVEIFNLITYTPIQSYMRSSIMVEVNMAERAPAQAPRVVLTATRAAIELRPADETCSTEPGLKPKDHYTSKEVREKH